MTCRGHASPLRPTPRFPGAGAVPGGILTWFLMWQPVLSWAAILTLGHASIGTAPGLGALDLFCAVIPSQNIFLCIKGSQMKLAMLKYSCENTEVCDVIYGFL